MHRIDIDTRNDNIAALNGAERGERRVNSDVVHTGCRLRRVNCEEGYAPFRCVAHPNVAEMIVLGRDGRQD